MTYRWFSVLRCIFDCILDIPNKGLGLHRMQGLHEKAVIFVQGRFNIILEHLVFHFVDLILQAGLMSKSILSTSMPPCGIISRLIGRGICPLMHAGVLGAPTMALLS